LALGDGSLDLLEKERVILLEPGELLGPVNKTTLSLVANWRLDWSEVAYWDATKEYSG